MLVKIVWSDAEVDSVHIEWAVCRASDGRLSCAACGHALPEQPAPRTLTVQLPDIDVLFHLWGPAAVDDEAETAPLVYLQHDTMTPRLREQRRKWRRRHGRTKKAVI